MDIEMIERVYGRYARSYDLYFGELLQPGRRAVIERMRCRPGERILEVGVGTGLSLPLYPPQTKVYGIDISPEMLARARARVVRENLVQSAGVCRMNAEHMGFTDDTFDKVVAMYVVSVVSDPGPLVDEMRRVCKPDGELFFVNHFLHANSAVSAMERAAAPLCRFLGFHPTLSLNGFVREASLEVVEQLPVNAFGYWTLLRARNNKHVLPRHAV
jgi:phosphatidylethanolamine/phosphatidyl-N-methylethanolamine N-methyltransferase